ncbi:uncharacterized protein LOC129949433 [Eupeodes corollae]|uniref:uncharacterized protein LOC129949433 n=1 Tax=Eupeodes corollae TaxID=290404 RepID=UPI00249270E8|nr:uncharacterized protein LOC129949433 [Eupeodes corollae]XP_055916865.1 uncharacterized protein LOC129949433 [Eupeodes corollae]
MAPINRQLATTATSTTTITTKTIKSPSSSSLESSSFAFSSSSKSEIESCRAVHHHQCRPSSSPSSSSSSLSVVCQKRNSKFSLSSSSLLVLMMYAALSGQLMADCPNLCECKWKSGKESVLCLNANLSQVPQRLDAGTQVLDLTGNEISSIPHDTFANANLLNLQKVFMAKCRLRTLERFAFRKLSNLVELDLSYNQLTAVPSQSFESIPELREIKLTGNPIYRVAAESFVRVPQLVRLELSDCKIGVVESRAFAGLEATLEWLKLDGNRLNDIRSSTLTVLSNLHGLELARNQWNCSCALRPLRSWMLRENIPYGIPPVCRAPPRLIGKTWDKIDLDDFACVPQIIATDTTAHGVEGRNVTMSCYVEGVPEPNVRWMVKNRVIANLSGESSPRTSATTQGRKMYVVNLLRNASNLTILTADMQDAGIYTCAAENKAGKVEASVTLAVSRRPPEAPLGVKIILVCILIALLFVVGSSFAAICFCSLRKRRKMRLWNTPAARTESYEKIEMSGRGNNKPHDMRQFRSSPNVGGTGGGSCGVDENGWLGRHMENGGIALVNTNGDARRNGEYRNVPTDDDGTGYEDSDNNGCTSFSLPLHQGLSRKDVNGNNGGSGNTQRWKGVTLKSSPQEVRRKNSSGADGDADLHIPRLIDISSGPETVASSISSQVDAAARLSAGYTWSSKKTSPLLAKPSNVATTYIGDDVNSSVFCSSRTPEVDFFDSKYPDLLDMSKYTNISTTLPTSSIVSTTSAIGGGLCTLPRKLKNTGKYFKNSSDSQSPLLADNSSKYGSSTLGDATYLGDFALGRRFSAESCSNYTGVRTTSQRSNSYLNLVQSSKAAAGIATSAHRRNPSLPSSPVHEVSTTTHHQRSFSSAATPLLDFSSLTSRSGGVPPPSTSTVTAYDYHAAQLERFLEEYRNLQDQLCKMKETCDTIRKKEAPLRGSMGHPTQFADPVMYNGALGNTQLGSDCHTPPNPMKQMLKNKAVLPGQPPEPPPYWLHRNVMLKRLNDSQTDIFKS